LTFCLELRCPDTRAVTGQVPSELRDPTVWAELVFADPIADIAVLRTPDNQELYEQADAYDALTETVSGFSMAGAKSGSGWFLSIDGKWTSIRLDAQNWRYGQSLEIDPTVHGQSGSPILNDNGDAVGVIAIACVSNEGTKEVVHIQYCPDICRRGWACRSRSENRQKPASSGVRVFESRSPSKSFFSTCRRLNSRAIGKKKSFAVSFFLRWKVVQQQMVQQRQFHERREHRKLVG
jgi:hypothetical protein